MGGGGGGTNVLGGNPCPSVIFLHPKICTWIGPGLLGGRPVTNCLNTFEVAFPALAYLSLRH